MLLQMGAIDQLKSLNLVPDKMENTDTSKVKKLLVPYSDTGFFNKMVLDYISGNEALRPFYHRLPKLESFGDQIKEKSANYKNREALVNALAAQYALAKLKTPMIDLLKSDNSYTITTGHQVCLFTGPLYFFYKIASAIKTCALLKKQHPNKDFIPIFWMATEDHDFEEANHFYLPTGKVEWESGQGGAVGRMETVGMDEVLEELKSQIGFGYSSGELINLFSKAYIEHRNIADATRFLVHSLFGKHGVVVIDGDDAALKKLAIPAFANEITGNLSAEAIASTNKALVNKSYALQVKAHDINLFYLDDQLRERIEKNENGSFHVAHTKRQFSESELLQDLLQNPERFSPNVILRPLYQEIVLPNLAYIGGGGELAYWFQLKDVFDRFDVPFPVLMLRNSILLANVDVGVAMENLGIDIHDIFRNQQELEDKLVREESSEKLELDDERGKVETAFRAMESRLGKIDSDLKKSVRSGFVRTERIIHNLEKKMMRAERKKQEILVSKLQKVHNMLLPRDGLQERNMNFTPFYLEFGDKFVDVLIEEVDPFGGKFTVLHLGG